VTTLDYKGPGAAISRAPFWLPSRQQVPFLVTLVVCVLLYFAAGWAYPSFFKPYTIVNLLINENAMLGIVAIGLTFVILSGGIDLSVGSVVGCTGIALATLIMDKHIHPAVAIAIVLAGGLVLGIVQGSLIHFFDLPPFLVTLGGLFFCRGLGLVISTSAQPIRHPFYTALAKRVIPITTMRNGAPVDLSFPAIVLLVVVAVSIYLALYTRFGRSVYAIGGSESSAILMGLPVGRTKVGVYAFSGFCAALSGVLFTIHKGSGWALDASGWELDAIAAVVAGGTLLVGGIGQVAGTVLGVLIFAIIQNAITFDGRLTNWWTRIALGALLLVFILLQRVLQFGKGSSE
jgi:simple sugar transport system permease protein